MVYDGSRPLFISVWIRLIIEGITDIAYGTDPAYMTAYIGISSVCLYRRLCLRPYTLHRRILTDICRIFILKKGRNGPLRNCTFVRTKRTPQITRSVARHQVRKRNRSCIEVQEQLVCDIWSIPVDQDCPVWSGSKGGKIAEDNLSWYLNLKICTRCQPSLCYEDFLI